jgi:hypothetical protein
MLLAAIAEDRALYEERYESHVAKRETERMPRRGDRVSHFVMAMPDRFGSCLPKWRMIGRQRSTRVLSWRGWGRDADEYEWQKMALAEHRESLAHLAFRNVEGHRILDVEGTMKADKHTVNTKSTSSSGRDVIRTVGNYATNPFFLEDLFNTTTHEHHNNWHLVRIVLWASLGCTRGQETEDWTPKCIFSFLINLEFERVWWRDGELYSTSGHKNAAPSSRGHTK